MDQFTNQPVAILDTPTDLPPCERSTISMQTEFQKKWKIFLEAVQLQNTFANAVASGEKPTPVRRYEFPQSAQTARITS